MRKARILVLMAVVMLFVTFDASASWCYKCREQTCYLLEGSNSWCKSITNGCFAGGTCTPKSCGDHCVENPTSELREPLGSEWTLVKVAVRTEKAPNARLAVTKPANRVQ